MTWLIESGEGDPVPHYYTNKNYAGALMFVPEIHNAFKFETEEAAQMFANRRMSHMRVTIVERKNG